MAQPDEADMAPGGARRGRPAKGTEATRRRALLQAAEDIFLNQGFGAACMDVVAKRAGVSKKTIYGFVSNKEELFAAVMRDHVEQSPPPPLPEEVATAAEVERALVEHLSELGRIRLLPFVLKLFRVTIAEAPRFPEIARTFYREGPQRHADLITGWLQRQVEKGLIVLDNPAEAATILTSAIIVEPLRVAALLGEQALPTPAAMEARAKMVAQFFLHGCLPPKP
jgi:AcrR family transcriptional regulator